MEFNNIRKKFISGNLSRRRISIAREQKKLEDLVAELYAKGGRNMGNDERILRQSSKLDKLIVNEMMLRDMEKKVSDK
jgi:hypothetical protein